MTKAAPKKSSHTPAHGSNARERNLCKTGLISLISMCVIAIFASRIPKFLEPVRDEYVCTTSLAYGFNGLHPGSEVWFGGVICGEVLEIKTVINPKTAVPTQLDAVFNLNQEIILKQDAHLSISSDLTGGEAVLEIINQGQLPQAWPEKSPRIIPLNETSRGATNFMGIRAANVFTASRTSTTNFIETARPVLDDLDQTTDHIRIQLETLTKDFSTSLPAWKSDSSNIIGQSDHWANQWSNIRSLVSQMSTAVNPLREIASWAQGDGRTQLERIRTAITEIRRNGNQIRGDFVDVELHAQNTLTKAKEVIDHGDQVFLEIQRSVPDLRNSFNHILVRNSLAGAQLSLLFKDIFGVAIEAVSTVPNDASWNRRILFESIESVNLALESLSQTQHIIDQVLSTHSSTLKENPQILHLLTEAASRDSQVMNEKLQALYQLFLRRSTK